MKTAGAEPAAPESVETGADTTTTIDERLRGARKRAGMTLDHAADQAGCSFTHLSALELGVKRPSVKLALRLSELYGLTLEALGLQLRRCSCSPECDSPTFGKYAQRHELGLIASRARQAEAEQLSRYKLRYHMLGTPELADRLGVSRSLITLWVRDGLLPGRCYPGPYPAEARRPLVFGRSEIALALALAASTSERLSGSLIKSWRHRPREPRDLLLRPCVRPGCPNFALFRDPWELSWRKGYCTQACSAQDRWSVERRYDESANLKPLVESWPTKSKKRQALLRALNGALDGKLGGRPPSELSPEIKSEIHRRKELGQGRRTIGPALGISERAVRKELAA